MSLIMNSSTNFNGTSTINGENIASFSADYDGNNTIHIYKTIELFDKYLLNKEEVDADITEFESEVINKVSE